MALTWKPTRLSVTIYFFLCAAGILAAGVVSIASGKTSLLRIGLLGVALLLCVGLCWLGLKNLKDARLADWWQVQANGDADRFLIAASTFSFLAGWFVAWTPLERFGSFYYYILGILPFIIWLTCASAAGLLLLASARFGLNTKRMPVYFQDQRMAFISAAAVLGLFGLLAWAAASRVVGMQPGEEDFWYGAGAPLLAFQVQLAFLAGLGLTALSQKWVERNPSRTRQADILIFLLIWAVSAWLWAREPVRSDFLVTAPVAPNFEMYPDYDARNYDIMSQYALIGKGINNYSFFDRALYPAFLVYLHNLAGQDYERLMAIQAALFAVFPALLYLLGKKLHSRGAGLVLGILITLRGINQIEVGNLIETAHQKYMLTEYPTAILLALATLLLVKWAQNPSKNWPLAGLAGGVIGFSTLLRPHPLALIPLVVALTALVYRKKARLWLGVSGLVASAAILSILPWVQFSGQNTSLIDLYLRRIKDVIQQRYPQFLQPSGNQPEPSTLAWRSLHLAQLRPAPPVEKSAPAFAADNFLNNLVTAAQILPATPFNLEPRVVVKKTDNFWKPYWDGSLTPWARILLPLNLLFVALGLGTAWRRARLSGLIPLFIMLTYFVVNALARTSGGRYLVPVDWVMVIYYVLGLVTVAELGLAAFATANPQTDRKDEEIVKKTPWWASALTVLLVSGALGALIPLAQKINPLRFQPLPSPELRSQYTAQLANQFSARAGEKLGLSSQNLLKFLSTENAIILEGRSLYPRQMNKDEGLDISVYDFYHPLPYPRTLFTLLGPYGENVILLPRTDPARVANITDVMVLGCRADGYVQAWAVVLMDDNSVFERLPPGSPLACPLVEPVCDNNKQCH